MSVSLYINGKKIRFGGSFGWFSGEPFRLLYFDFFEVNEGLEFLTILDLQITRLSLNFYVSWDD